MSFPPPPKLAVALLAIVYTVGVLGLNSPMRELFARLTPVTLLLTLVVMLSYHRRRGLGLVVFSCLVLLGGFFVEWVGVHTGWLFGRYQYLEALGPKLDGVSVIIGVNWLLLVYAIGVFVQSFSVYAWRRVVLGALVMVATDLLIEPVAISLGFWTWEGGGIPLLNYLGWFVVSVAFFTLFEKMRLPKTNPVAGPVFGIMFLFFLTLNLISGLL